MTQIPKHGYYMDILWASYKQRRWNKRMLCAAFLESCSCLPLGSEALPSASSAVGKAEQAALEEAALDPESEASGVAKSAADRAAWMRFHRSLQAPGTRKSRGEKCPAHIRESINQDPLKHGYYMDLWASQQESWGAAIACERRFLIDNWRRASAVNCASMPAPLGTSHATRARRTRTRSAYGRGNKP